MELIEKKVVVSTHHKVERKKHSFNHVKVWRSRWTADLSLLLVALIWE